MKMVKSKAVKKFYYCYCCKNFISQPTYDSEEAKCPKCGCSVVKIKEPKSENEAWAVLFQLAILSRLDVDKLRNADLVKDSKRVEEIYGDNCCEE
jgi:hypothetical protein